MTPATLPQDIQALLQAVDAPAAGPVHGDGPAGSVATVPKTGVPHTPLTAPPVAEEPAQDRDRHGKFLPGNKANPLGGPNLRKPKVAPLPIETPETPELFNEWLGVHTGYRLPGRSVCSGHTSPLDAVWAVFTHQVDEAVILASRGSGKTLALAALHIANSVFKPTFETNHFGAIMTQAERAHKYINEATRRSPLDQAVTDVLKKRVSFANGSELTIAPLTERQSQSPHAALVSVDEVESAKSAPLERARSIPMQHDGHPGQLILCSTRVEAHGMMDATLEDARERGVPIFEWCWLESIEPCTIEPDSPLYEFVPAALRLDSGPVTIDSDGWRLLEDMVAAHARVSKETWATEYMNARPAAQALVYPSPPIVTEEAEFVPGGGTVHLGGDWGFTDKTALLLAQLRDGKLYLFHELTGKGTSEREWVRRVIKVVVELEGYDGPSYEQWEAVWKSGAWKEIIWPLDFWPKGSVDPSAIQLRSEFKAHGVGMVAPKRVKHHVPSGQDIVSALLRGRLFIHPRCEETILSLQNFRTKQLPDGSYSATPDPDARNHRWSHCPDALRYMCWTLRRRLGLSAEPIDDDTDENEGD